MKLSPEFLLLKLLILSSTLLQGCTNIQLFNTSNRCAKSLQSRQTLCDPVDRSPPGPPSMGFFMQEYWNGLPFPPPDTEISILLLPCYYC